MAAPAHGVQYSLRDYLDLEAAANVKHEFLEVWARGHDGQFSSDTFPEGAIVPLPAIGARLAVTELYDAAAEPNP
jgi:hypothetical protein